MNNSTLGKVAGWFQFAMTLFGQFAQQGVPHGWQNWVVSLASLAAAVGIHASSSTDGTK